MAESERPDSVLVGELSASWPERPLKFGRLAAWMTANVKCV